MKSSGPSGQASRPTAIFATIVTGTIQFLIEWLKIDGEVATATYDSVVKVFDEDINKCAKGLGTVIEETRKNLKVNREVPLSDVADLSIFRKSKRNLGSRSSSYHTGATRPRLLLETLGGAANLGGVMARIFTVLLAIFIPKPSPSGGQDSHRHASRRRQLTSPWPRKVDS